ncbi:TlpA disulfide reductase family protein [Alienimonas chondri]|uniref:Thiol-disulfide oxidoreductase ResA n=1 Tax=Alienimonas chondri TaxID=2681879 RepID=A0ABX1VG75_9PLAN|nr:TlpA disulfide reductase family protein [Alienimonas chondri]NNJ26842.1 Thiol-disulfide oxidoreductase ResA [Alienimonas chondri]
MRFAPPYLFAVAALCLSVLPAATAQEDAELTEEVVESTPEMSEEALDALAEKLADRVSKKVAKKLEAKLEADVDARVAAMEALLDEKIARLTDPDAELRAEVEAMIEKISAERIRDTYLNYVSSQWPVGEPAEEHAVDLAIVLYVVGNRLEGDEQYEAFALAGDMAHLAVEAGTAEPGRLGSVFYNSACALAVEGEPEAAVEELILAVKYGFDDMEQLKTDEDLAAVRELDGFADRVAGWEADIREAAIAEAKKALAEGESFPLEFTFTDIKGEEHTLADYKGQVVIVDFWGTWCPPCRAEIPSFIKLQDTYGNKGLQILGLNYGDEEEQAAEYAEENDMNYPTGLGSDETKDAVPNFRGYPTTVFVGRDGKVRMQVVGLHDYVFLDAVVSELLAEAAPAEEAEEEDAKDDEPETTEAAGDEV